MDLCNVFGCVARKKDGDTLEGDKLVQKIDKPPFKRTAPPYNTTAPVSLVLAQDELEEIMTDVDDDYYLEYYQNFLDYLNR